MDLAKNFPCAVAALVALATWAPAGDAPPRGALRAVWMSAHELAALSTRESLEPALDALARSGVNVLYPAVWTRGATLWPSALCESVTGARIDARCAGRDPLADLALAAHRRGIEVHPWFEHGFAASYKSGGGVLVRKKPEWAARDGEGRLYEQGGYEWLDALDPEVQAFLHGLVLEVARTYDVDGIQLGDKLPAFPAGAAPGAKALESWRREHGGAAPAANDPAWSRWRAEALSAFLEKLARDVRAAGPGLQLAVSTAPYPGCRDDSLQDVLTWIERGLVDIVSPQCFAHDADEVRARIDEQTQLLGGAGAAVAPSILAASSGWRIGASDLAALVAHARGGGALHGYDALRQNRDALLGALAEGPWKAATLVPRRRDRWRPMAIENGFDGETSLGTWEPIEGCESAFRESSGEPAELTFQLDAPVAATYQVWLEVPKDPALPPKLTRVFQAQGRKPDSAQVAIAPGMLALGVAEVPAGVGQFVLKIAIPPHETKRMAVGRAVLLLDRRRSPDVVWKDGS